ncbi:hypothetical protein WKI71_43205 [Streptomyces sp. MS1.AVA.1]|uniref:Uncharacterized protein n=1 Tax=Streptomyces machairae TaxID=3134109 RepID=A0ABU8UUW0_9ACTN
MHNLRGSLGPIGEGRAVDLVPTDHFGQNCREGVAIERSDQLDLCLELVGADTRMELQDEPQPLL